MKHEYDAAMTFNITCFAMFKCLFPPCFPLQLQKLLLSSFFLYLWEMYFLQFSFERLLANTRLHLLRVKGPSVNLYFSLLSIVLFDFCVDFWTLLYLLELLLHSCSSLPLSLSLSALCHPSISLNLLSVTLHIWPSLYLDIPATGRSFSLFFFVFLCSPLPFDKGDAWLHDSLGSVSSPHC